MTQLKKLLFVGAVAIGPQSTAHTYFTQNDYEYLCATTNSTVSLLSFAELLRQNNSIDATKIAEWLESEIAIPYYLTQDDMIRMAYMADNKDLMMESKIRIFQLKMNQKTPRKFITKAVIMLAGVSAICCIAANDCYTGCLDKIVAQS